MIRKTLVALVAISLAIPSFARRPLVFLHGWNSSGSIWTEMKKLLKNNMGYSDDDMHAFSYYNNYFGYSKSTPIQTVAEGVAREIAEIYVESGDTPVDIVAHSMGGLIVRTMLAYDLIDPKCIGRFVSIAVPHYGQNVDNDLGGYQSGQMKYGSLFLWNLADSWHFRGKTIPDTLCIAGIDQKVNESMWDGLVHCWSAALGDTPVRYVLKCHSPSVSIESKVNTVGGGVLGGLLGGLPGLIIGSLVGNGTADNTKVIYKCSGGVSDDVYVLVSNFLDPDFSQVYPQSSLKKSSSALSTATSQGGIFFQIVDSGNVPAQYKSSDTCLVHTYWHEEKNKRIVADYLEHGNNDHESQREGVELVYGTMPVGTYDLVANPSGTTSAFTAQGVKVEGGRMTVVRLRQDGHVLGALKKVRFEANGGVDVPTMTRYSGEELGALPATRRDKFVFNGWWTARTGGDRTNASMVVNDDLVLYAHWTPVDKASFPIRVVVSGKGTVKGAGVNKYKSKVTLCATPGKRYVFAGWYDGTALKSRSKKYSFKMPAKEVNLIAKFITKEEDLSGIGMDFCGMGFGARAKMDEPFVPAVMTNVCGVVTTWPIEASGYTAVSVSVKGQPKGMSYNAAKKSVTGVPSVANKSGTMKVTVKSAGSSRSWTVGWRTVPLPAVARGTFNGWTYAEGDARRKVTVSVTKAGKISAKVGTIAFSRVGWIFDEPSGGYVAKMQTVKRTGVGKNRTARTNVLTLALDPNAAWTQDQLTGAITTFNGSITSNASFKTLYDDCEPVPMNEDVNILARRNPFSDITEAKEVAYGLAARGTLKLTDAAGPLWNLNVKSNGVVRISRVVCSGKIRKTLTGTSVVEITMDDDAYTATARFLVDGQIVEMTW